MREREYKEGSISSGTTKKRIENLISSLRFEERRTQQLHSTELYSDGISTIRWDCHITHIFFFTTMRQDDDDDGMERSENSQAKIVSWINFYPMKNFSLCKRARILKNSSYFLHCHWLCNCISAYLSFTRREVNCMRGKLGKNDLVSKWNWDLDLLSVRELMIIFCSHINNPFCIISSSWYVAVKESLIMSAFSFHPFKSFRKINHLLRMSSSQLIPCI